MIKIDLILVFSCFIFIACAPGSCEKPLNTENSQLSMNPQQDSQSSVNTEFKTLRVDLPQPPYSFDPLTANDDVSKMFILSIYDRLTEVHYKNNEFVVQPLLLRELPEPLNKAQTKFKMQLNRGVYFHSHPAFGKKKTRELIAEDVNYSFRRFADYRQNSFHYYLLHGLISGFSEFRKKTFDLERDSNKAEEFTISGIKVLDRYSFEINLDKPHPLFFRILADSSLSIVPKEVILYKNAGLNRRPIGSGPYTLEKNKIDKSFVLRKNMSYFKRDPLAIENLEINSRGLKNLTPRLPYIDLITLHFVGDPLIRVNNFISGMSHILLPSEANIDELILIGDEIHMKSEHVNNFQLVHQQGWDRRYILFNPKRPAAKIFSLRKVIAQLIYNEVLETTNTFNKPNNIGSVLPFNIVGSQESIETPLLQLDDDAFADLLNSAKVELRQIKGPPLLIYNRQIPGSRLLAEKIRDLLKKHGLRLALSELNYIKYNKYFLNGTYDMAIFDWKNAYADAEEFFGLSYNFGEYIRRNISGFNNPTYNKLYERAYGIADSNVRFRLQKQMQQILSNEVPLIPIDLPPQLILSHRSIKNLNIHPINTLVLKYLNIESTSVGL